MEKDGRIVIKKGKETTESSVTIKELLSMINTSQIKIEELEIKVHALKNMFSEIKTLRRGDTSDLANRTYRMVIQLQERWYVSDVMDHFGLRHYQQAHRVKDFIAAHTKDFPMVVVLQKNGRWCIQPKSA